MTATDTSVNAYQKLKENGTIGKQCQLVFDILKMSDQDMTINELAELTGLPKGTVSGRLNDLKDDHGLVQDLSGDAKRKDKHTNIKSKVWTTTISKEKEFVSDLSKVESIDTSEDMGLFEDIEQGDKETTTNDKTVEQQELEPGDVIYG